MKEFLKKYPLLWSFVGGFTLLGLGLPAGISLKTLPFLALLFLVGTFLLSWILFWKNQTKTKKNRRIFWVVLSVMSPFILWGILSGGLLGPLGILLLAGGPMILVFPLLIFGLKKQWKRFGIVLAITSLPIGAFLYFQNSFQESLKVDKCVFMGGKWDDTEKVCRISFIQDIKNHLIGTKIDVPETDAQAEIVPVSPQQLGANFLDEDIPGKIMLDTKNITPVTEKLFLMPLVVNNGGSGSFYHIGLYLWKKPVIESLDSHFLGDRIKITDITAKLTNPEKKSYEITVHYLTRTPDQSMSEEPTQPTSFSFQITSQSESKTVAPE